MIDKFFDKPLTIRSIVGDGELEEIPKGSFESFHDFGGRTKYSVNASPFNLLHTCDDPVLAAKIFTIPRSYVGAPIYAAIIPRCLVSPCGAVVMEDGTLILESLYSYNKVNFLEGYGADIELRDQSLFLRRGRQVNSNSELIIYNRDIGEYGYFHWMNSILPRFGVLSKIPGTKDAKIFVTHKTKFALGSLELLKIDPARFQGIGGDFQFCERLLFLSPWVIAGNHWTRPPEIRSFYEFFKQDIGISGQISEKLIYLSRSDAPVRRLINEQQAYDGVMRRKKLEAVTTTGMNMADQAALFDATRVCVSVHGAGLSNLVYMQPGGTVIEIISPDRLWPTFRSLAARMRLNYVAISGIRAKAGEFQPGSLQAGNEDFEIPLESLDFAISSCI